MKDLIKNKKFWLGFIGIIIVAVVITTIVLIGLKKDTGVGTAGISKEEFSKIEIGMSQTTVNSIIDNYDEWNDNETYKECCQEINKSNENHIYKYTYKYLGENGGYVIITYEADYSSGNSFVLPTVSKKEQFNLK